MSGNVSYKRKILSEKTMTEYLEIREYLYKKYKEINVEKFGIYLDDDNKAVYGLYIGDFLLKGESLDILEREIEIYKRFNKW